MYATNTITGEDKGYQHFMFISFGKQKCGKLWKATKSRNNRGKVGILQIHKARALVARQREDGGIHIRMDMLLAELLIQALHGSFRCVIVLTEVAEHDVFHT